jgi:hypothetical protein
MAGNVAERTIIPEFIGKTRIANELKDWANGDKRKKQATCRQSLLALEST